ncbi:transaldolase family protein [Halomicroarcula sp. GCM10025710]
MKLYLDTADIDQIRSAVALGVVDGVTTNPSIIAASGLGYREAVTGIDDVVDGPIFAQVVGESADEMVEQAHRYQDWADDVVAKIPASRAGFEALARLRDDGVPAGSTVVFSVEQAVLAAKNDADFVAPYVGRLDDAGADGLETVRRMQRTFDRQEFDTDVLAASVRNTTQATALYEAGIDAITMGPDLLDAHVGHPKTDEGIAGFDEAWGDRGAPSRSDRPAHRPRHAISTTGPRVSVWPKTERFWLLGIRSSTSSRTNRDRRARRGIHAELRRLGRERRART